MPNPLAGIMKALGGAGAGKVTRSPGVRIPQFGPRPAGAAMALGGGTPAPGGVGAGPSPGLQDMLSRPKRTPRMTGYKKTAPRMGAGPKVNLGAAPSGNLAGGMPPGGGPSLSGY